MPDFTSGLCQSWTGPISLALFIPNATMSLRNVEQSVAAIVDQCRPMAMNESTIAVISILFGIEHDRWYPINHLRNIALQQAISEYVFLVDSDFVPSHGLYEMLHMEPYQKLLRYIEYYCIWFFCVSCIVLQLQLQ